MKIVYRSLLAFLFSLSFDVFALPCKTQGLDILKLSDGTGFMFYVYTEKSDLVFFIPGKSISFPEKELASRFYIGETLFEYMYVETSTFISKKGLADLDVLKAHTKYEQNYLISLKTPLSTFKEFGERVKPATKTQPEFTFYLWQAKDPEGKAGGSQFYLSTVSSGGVFFISAIAGDSDEETAKSALQQYAGTFHHISSVDQCPKK